MMILYDYDDYGAAGIVSNEDINIDSDTSRSHEMADFTVDVLKFIERDYFGSCGYASSSPASSSYLIHFQFLLAISTWKLLKLLMKTWR